VVTNGKVYVAAHGEVDVYGLLNAPASAAAPVINPNGGTFSTSQSVQISSSTPSASIFYTLDGSTPTPTSTQYTVPIAISANTTIKAIATAPGLNQSSVTTANFTFLSQVPPITFAPAAGTYATPQTVTLTDADTNAKIYYTTDGSVASATSTLYTAPIQVSASETINAVAIDPAMQNSNIGTAAYVIQQPSFTLTGGPIAAISAGGSASSTITITPAGGFTGTVSLSCAISSSPAGGVAPPTCSVSQPAAISGTQAVTSTLTIKTTAASTAALHNPMRPFLKLGEGTLVAILFLWLPFRRRNWQTMFGLLLLTTLAVVASGCGASKSSATTQGSSGTTAGAYTITVTGTSGTVQSTASVSLSVQ
jgi:hypothetical protein